MRSFVVFLFLFPILLSAAIVHISQLPPELAEVAQPDVMGLVNVADDTLPADLAGPPRIPPSVWSDWPVTATGATYEGGIVVDVGGDGSLEVVQNIGPACYVFYQDGSVMNGWPQSMNYQPYGAPAFGDIDGDGEGEIVVNARQVGTGNDGRIYAWEADGTAVTGFPVNPNGGPTRSVCLGDLDGDDDMEIIAEVRDYPDGYVYVYQGDGSVMTGWPQQLDYIPASSAACGDITGDGIPEIVCESYYQVWAYDADGNVLDGWPYSPGTDRVFSYSAPVLADIDADGVREVIVGDHSSVTGDGKVHCIENDGTLMAGWPQSLDNWIYAPVAVGDIDGDGGLDLAVGDQVMSGTPVTHVAAWHADGTALAGWPVGPVWSINTQCIIADLDGDDEVELMWDDNTANSYYLGYNHDGTAMEDFPLAAPGGMTFFITPAVADIDDNGYLDILGGATNGDTAVTNLYVWGTAAVWNDDLAYTPMHQFNPYHNGVYRYGETPEPPPICGDVDGDGEVTETDADIVLAYTAMLDPIPEIDPRPWESGLIDIADVDDDAFLLAYDASLILQKANGVIDSFPAETGVMVEAPAAGVELSWSGENNILTITAIDTLYSLNIEVLGEYIVFLNYPQNLADGLWQSHVDDENETYSSAWCASAPLYEGQTVCRIPTYNLPGLGITVNFNFYANDTYQQEVILLQHVGVNDNTPDALAAKLGCSPNPFNPSTTVRYTLPEAGETRLRVYNARGQLVRTLVQQQQPAGQHEIVWQGRGDDGTPVASGVYLLKLDGPGVMLTRKVLLLK